MFLCVFFVVPVFSSLFLVFPLCFLVVSVLFLRFFAFVMVSCFVVALVFYLRALVFLCCILFFLCVFLFDLFVSLVCVCVLRPRGKKTLYNEPKLQKTGSRKKGKASTQSENRKEVLAFPFWTPFL